MPEFCRHNRFLERCPICSKTLPGDSPGGRPSGGAPRRKASSAARTRTRRGAGLRVQRQQRATEDGYSSPLLPGLRASADAARLAEEIAFSSGRLLVLQGTRPGLQPPDLYAQVRALVSDDLEQATWTCFLIAYLCPLEGPEPFAGIRQALEVERGALHDLSGIALGPRTSHEPARGTRTLDAYRQWVAQASGSGTVIGQQALAFSGDPSWTPQRRFERLFERISLPGLTRAARFELLVLLGALGVYELEADSLHLSARARDAQDPATLAAKRMFAIGDPLLLDRRAAALAGAIAVPVGSLELALANWCAGERATLGFTPEATDGDALERARDALGL
jgi:Alpha-glutamyl/putrescinyl thymine pyrophosphorylase clade 3